MNRSLTLLVALVVIATQVFVLPIQADEPTPARRPSNRAAVNRDGKAAQVPLKQNSNTQSQKQAVSTRRSAANASSEPARQNQPVGSGVVKAVNRPSEPTSSRNNIQQASATARRSNSTSVAQASHNVVNEVYDEGYEGGEYIVDEGSEYVDGGSCDTCSSGTCGGLACGSPCRTNWGFDLCNPGRGGRQLCICLPSHGWVQMDYLMWWQRGMNIPPLLTEQDNAADDPRLILGNQDILNERRSGGRIRFGWWFANNPNLGIELEYLGLGNDSYDFSDASTGANGTRILARPFFNVLNGTDEAQLVSNPDAALRLGGRFDVNAYSQLDGAAVRFRRALCCSSGSGISPWACGPVPTQSRIDATLGWRFFQLKEGLLATETINQATPVTRSYTIIDDFKTRNQFNGVELGIQWQGRRGYWSLDGMMRTSLGNNHQSIDISGSTVIDGAQPPAQGGILALPSNSGFFTNDNFAVIQELGATLGYQLTPRWRANVGYTFIYWSSVVRPGDQIDTTLNPNQFPTAINPLTGANRPSLTLLESDYWVQGLNLGLEYRW